MQPPSLTSREEDVVALVIEGRSNKEIASELRIGVRTVRFHVSNLLKKFQVSTRMELTAVWHKLEK